MTPSTAYRKADLEKETTVKREEKVQSSPGATCHVSCGELGGLQEHLMSMWTVNVERLQVGARDGGWTLRHKGQCQRNHRGMSLKSGRRDLSISMWLECKEPGEMEEGQGGKGSQGFDQGRP